MKNLLAPHSIPDIILKGVTKKFPNSVEPTLRGIDLKLMPTEIHSILGASGIGKSVTLKVVLGFLRPDAGQVEIKGKNILAMDNFEITRMRRVFGMLFQNSALFDSFSVYENVAFPLREHRRDLTEKQIHDRVHELLEMVNLSNAENKMPSEISGGMRKRVGLARALAMDPEIILCDEPTTGLDPVTTEIIDNLIRDTTRKLGASALIISHDVHAALRISDYVSMLAEGRIIESAPPEQFRASENPVVRRFLESAGVV